MEIVEKKIKTGDYLTKSNLPASDYVINPYVGCPHACKYCYAGFMKRFTGHQEEWGEFLDIKECEKPISLRRIKGKSVFISSVTDCYNLYEKKYKITRKILEQLVDADCSITISTKSNLILRDIDLLKKLKNLKVALSINTLDENFRSDMDAASTIEERLSALQVLHDAGIYTVVFISPIFPYLTDCREIINQSKNIASEYWLENLNLRGAYKQRILAYIDSHYPELMDKYEQIFIRKDFTYWRELSWELEQYCTEMNVNYVNYFYHEELVREKRMNKKPVRKKPENVKTESE